MSAPLAYDPGYLKSISGVLKISCLFCCLLGIVSIVSGAAVPLHNFRACFYCAVVLFAFMCTLCVLLARLFQVWQRKFHNFNAAKYECYLHGFLAFACIIAASVTVTLDVMSYSMATFFGFLAFSFYAFDAYIGYRLSRQSDAQTQTQT